MLRSDATILGVGGGTTPGEARSAAMRAMEASRETLTFVCKSDDIPRERCREFRVGRRRVLLCEHAGEVFAHSPLCPHQGNPLDGARLWGELIDCPWHHFQFHVVTGENVYPRRVYPTDRGDLEPTVRPLKSYRTCVRDGMVFVEFPARAHGARRT